jgi:uncharacterized membrane protein YccC
VDHEHSEPQPFWRSPAGLTLWVATAVGGFLLFTEHRAHVLGLLPYAFLLACPLMHMFMHHDHHHGDHRRTERTDDERPRR